MHFWFEAWVGEMFCWWQWHGGKCCPAFCKPHALRSKAMLSVGGSTSLRAIQEAKLLPVGIIFAGPMLPSSRSSAVSCLDRSVSPVAAFPGLLCGDSFQCLMGWTQSGSSLADSCSSEKNWGVVLISACFCYTVLVKDLKAVVASGA